MAIYSIVCGDEIGINWSKVYALRYILKEALSAKQQAILAMAEANMPGGSKIPPEPKQSPSVIVFADVGDKKVGDPFAIVNNTQDAQRLWNRAKSETDDFKIVGKKFAIRTKLISAVVVGDESALVYFDLGGDRRGSISLEPAVLGLELLSAAMQLSQIGQ